MVWLWLTHFCKIILGIIWSINWKKEKRPWRIIKKVFTAFIRIFCWYCTCFLFNWAWKIKYYFKSLNVFLIKDFLSMGYSIWICLREPSIRDWWQVTINWRGTSAKWYKLWEFACEYKGKNIFTIRCLFSQSNSCIWLCIFHLLLTRNIKKLWRFAW